MREVTSTQVPHQPRRDRAKDQRIAAASSIIWQTLFGQVESTTTLGRVIRCDVAAARLDELGLLDDLVEPRS